MNRARLWSLHGWRAVPFLALLTFVVHLGVITNPGFFSHDELQRADELRAHGLGAYLNTHLRVQSGPHMGHPIRPIGFAQQGLSALWIPDSPVVAHGIDVVLHAIVVILFWGVLTQTGFGSLALWAAAVFAFCPLGTSSVAWVGASFDRWYAFFFLVCVYGVVSAGKHGLTGPAISLVLAGSVGSILSKETAVMVPAALLIVVYGLTLAPGRAAYRMRPALAAVGLAALPIVAYLIIRWPAIVATLAGVAGGHSHYLPSASNVPHNLMVYFAQPFLWTELLELTVGLPDWRLWAGLFVHSGLVVAFAVRYGLRAALVYLCGYGVFLLPVLSLPAPAAHYAYACSLSFAVFVTLLLAPSPAANRTSRLLLGTGAALFGAFLLAYSLLIQEGYYEGGACQARFFESFQQVADAAREGDSSRFNLVAEPGARLYIAHRGIFARGDYSEGGRWPTAVEADAPRESVITLVMRTDCSVVRK